MTEVRVLLVEDDPVYAAVLRSTLAFAGGGPWVVESVESFAAARERLARFISGARKLRLPASAD